MIFGAHVVFYSNDAEADRGFFQDVLGFPSLDVGHGWLIFQLPPSEAAVHPADGGVMTELYFMCTDLKAEIAGLADKGTHCGPVEDAPWGSVTKIPLPSGAEIGLYEPRHPSPLAPAR